MDIPTIEEEVNRKFLDALVDMSTKLVDGRISKAQLDSGLNGAFAVGSGFLKSDVMELFSGMTELVDFEDDSFHPRSVWINAKQNILIVERDLPEQKIIAWLAHNGKIVVSISWSELPISEAESRIFQVISAKGYKRAVAKKDNGA
jgi:hypothetical protein